MAALTKKLGTPDAGTLQAMAALQAQVATLSAQANSRTVTEAVDTAIAGHKLMPAQRGWAMNLGTSDMAQLTAYLAATPAIPGLAGQTGGRRDLPAGPGNDDPQSIARDAVALQASQAVLGLRLSTPEAVDQVMATRAAAR